MASPALSRIIHGLPEPVLLVESEGTVVAVNPGAARLLRRSSPELLGQQLGSFLADDAGKISRYLRLCSRSSEGVPGGLHIQVPNEQPLVCKVVGGLVHHREEQPRLIWLRLLPRESANSSFAVYNERLVALTKEIRARQENEQRWRTAFERSAVAITMADLEGRFLTANSVFQAMLGYSETELRGMTFVDITHEEDREGNLELVRELREGKCQHFQIEKRYRRKDGELIWVRNNVTLVPGIGSVAPFLFAVIVDITERKRVEAELDLQIEVLQGIPALAWTVTPDGKCNFVNQSFLDATGMSREYIQSPPEEWNKSGSDLPPLFSGLPPQDRVRGARLFWNGIRSGEGWAFEAPYFHASDGTYHWHFDQAVPLRNPQGRIIRFVGTSTDIQPLKHIQEELRESESRLHTFFENSPTLTFMKDTEGRYLYVNKEFERALRISKEQITGKRDDEVFSPEQAAAFQANDRQVLQAGVPMEFEEMAMHVDGLHTSIVQKFPLFNTEGKPYAIGGIVTDITERKREEAWRRFSDDRYRVVVETANDAVVSADDKGNILFVNPATTRIFGYETAELIGQPLTILMPEYMRKLHDAGFRRYLHTGHRHINWQGTELVGLRKTGEEFPVEVSFGELAKDGHRVFTGFIRNISERKQAEELRAAQVRQAAVRADVSVAFGKENSLRTVLQECTEAIVRHLDASFARIWALNESDSVLELQASAGLYTHINGAHSRVPMGQLKIGLIAKDRKPLATNDVLNDPRISDRAWAKREGMVAFAGHPLVVGNHTLGVMAMFSRRPIAAGTLDTLASTADLIAQGIERKLAEERLRASERSLRQLTETIPQMLWSANPDGTIDYCNQRVLDYTGLSKDEIRGAGWMKAVHPEDVGGMTQAWATAVSTGEPFQYEFKGLHAIDQTYRWCISSALPLRDQKGRVTKWFGSVVDLHDWKEAQQALQMTQSELARVSRLTTMGELAASIAHEVNQPLTAVMNNCNACLRLLAAQNLSPDVLRGALEEIVADGTRASSVVARIRAFIKKSPAEKQQLDVNEVIQEVLSLVGRELFVNRVLLQNQLAKPLPPILGDRVQLQQVLLNLIMNAIEAMSGVTSRQRLLSVQSKMEESGGLLVALRDSGPGLNPEAVDRVFSPFFTTKPNGMGMGLSISRSLIEAHGGRLWAAPNSPYGATFQFTLPIATEDGS